ncbi:MAG: fasciclin domain-containing protein [Bacteroidaceae bacterium]|nr:fasciclin domain-containing protein [Bacteroidaceae bacterium]
MCKIRKNALLGLVATCLSFLACSEEIDTSARYVFTENTVVSYLEKHSDDYSEYVELLKKVPVSRRSQSTLYQLMSARGNYTCFAPTNDAIHEYLQQLVDTGLIAEPSWAAFPDSAKLDSIRQVIVKNSIIDGADLESQRFLISYFPTQKNGTLPLANLCEHKLTVSWPDDELDEYYINGICHIDSRNRDIELLNGVVHQIHKVIAPNDVTAATYFETLLDEKREGILLFSRALQACGLLDTLSVERDEVYEDLYERGLIPNLEHFLHKGFVDPRPNQDAHAYAPPHRLVGFTLFPETDEFWRSQGIDPQATDALERLTAWIVDNHQYSDEYQLVADNDYTSPRNMLYQWVTYHILPMRLQADKMVYHENEYGYSWHNPHRYVCPVYEYYTTMGARRLLKLYESSMSNGVCLNRFPVIDNGRKGTGKEISCDAQKVGCRVDREGPLTVVNDISNANIFPIDAPLSYSDVVRNNLARERIRFDGMALFPEAMTNEIRKKDSNQEQFMHIYIPPNSVYQYFENMSVNDDAMFVYFNGYHYDWENYTNDEMKAIGNYDMMFTLPPVPRRGTYEVRYKVIATGARGITQVYFGSDPNHLHVTGIPMDLRVTLDNPLTGWEADSPDDMDYNAEVDHRLRNNGFMNGAVSITRAGSTSYTERWNSICLRRILLRETLDPGKTYYLRLKSILDQQTNELYMDYIELCPKEIYDNPQTPEDIW